MLGLTENEFIVLGLDELTGRKGVDDFLDVAAAIPDVRFVWAGGRPFGGSTEGIKRINERFSNAGGNIINARQIDLEDMPFVYSAADLMLFPSYNENCPLSPIEAAAAGMPVIYMGIIECKESYINPYLKAGTVEEFISLTKPMIADRQYYNEGLMVLLIY